MKLQELKRLGENPAANNQSKGFNSDILSPDLGSFYYTHTTFQLQSSGQKEETEVSACLNYWIIPKAGLVAERSPRPASAMNSPASASAMNSSRTRDG